jgi:enoyl-CoA hydratase/carnithine racemase
MPKRAGGTVPGPALDLADEAGGDTCMTYKTLQFRREAAAAILTLDRPGKRNAVSLEMMGEIIEASKAAEADAGAAALILYGGQEFFSAGADLNEAVEIATASDALGYFGRWHQLTATLEGLAKPVIAAIEGFCFTGGLELALACDVRVAGAGATFAVTSSKIGTVAGAGGTQRLPRTIGRAKALELLFSADPIEADEASRIGLINRMVPAGDALAEAMKLAAIYAQRAPLALALAKRAVHRGMDLDLASGIEFEKMLVTTIYGTADKKEGITAFLEKRAPEFKGR